MLSFSTLASVGGQHRVKKLIECNTVFKMAGKKMSAIAWKHMEER